MIKVLFLFIFIFFSNNGYSFFWSKIHSDPKADFYIFSKTIKNKKNYIYTKMRIDSLEPIQSRSIFLIKLKVDCSKNKIFFINKKTYLGLSVSSVFRGNLNGINFLSDIIKKKLLNKLCFEQEK
tara:strand:+ start:35 stop:406 length:372 start_codon:yes stop_codon:yes gene_type:complete